MTHKYVAILRDTITNSSIRKEFVSDCPVPQNLLEIYFTEFCDEETVLISIWEDAHEKEERKVPKVSF